VLNFGIYIMFKAGKLMLYLYKEMQKETLYLPLLR